MKLALISMLAIALATLQIHAADDAAQTLKDLESQIAQAPEDPMLLMRKAQALMTLERRDEGFAVAKEAMALFVKSRKSLAWMMLEKIDLGHVRVDVHFNMGPRERQPPESGIIRPLSFRIWTKPEEGRAAGSLLEIIDFELGPDAGQPSTAALGQTTAQGHSNFGMLTTDSTYSQIRERVLALVQQRHPSPDKAEGSQRQ